MPNPILIRESPRERDNPIASLVHVVTSDDGQAIRDFELWWVLHGRDLPINWWNRHKNLMRESTRPTSSVVGASCADPAPGAGIVLIAFVSSAKFASSSTATPRR